LADGIHRDFSWLTDSLEKEFENRPSPEQILAHPWAVGMERMNVDMERWIKEAWGWKT
jgi:mitogen-activated protein kinase kinase